MAPTTVVPGLRASVLIPAAGSGQRMGGGTPKALRVLRGRTLLDHAIAAMARHPAVAEIVIAVPADHLAATADQLPEVGIPVRAVPGGADRQASVAAALRASDPSCGLVLVHDAARPFVPLAVIDRVVAALAGGAAAAVPGLPVTDTIKRVDQHGFVVETPPRAMLRAVQTPQGFRREVLLAAHAAAVGDAGGATDDAALAERAGFGVVVVAGDQLAMKITTPPDMAYAEQLLEASEPR